VEYSVTRRYRAGSRKGSTTKGRRDLLHHRGSAGDRADVVRAKETKRQCAEGTAKRVGRGTPGEDGRVEENDETSARRRRLEGVQAMEGGKLRSMRRRGTRDRGLRCECGEEWRDGGRGEDDEASALLVRSFRRRSARSYKPITRL
jgi:hypothetical protein